jgi:hypothetical protein
MIGTMGKHKKEIEDSLKTGTPILTFCFSTPSPSLQAMEDKITH